MSRRAQEDGHASSSSSGPQAAASPSAVKPLRETATNGVDDDVPGTEAADTARLVMSALLKGAASRRRV